MDKVETVQQDVEAVLRALASDHGQRRVLLEGLTPAGTETWRARIEGLAEMLATVPTLRRALSDAEHFRKPELVKQARELLEQGRRERLELGAVGVLASEGLLEALPLDENATLKAAAPRSVEGDGARSEGERDTAIVRRALTSASPVAVIVLGGGHDLSREIALQGGGRAEYGRLATRAYQRLVGR